MIVGGLFIWFRGPKGDEVVAEDVLDESIESGAFDGPLVGAPGA
jgi:hypothetical protein